MKVWVTRTRPGADRTARRLRELGHEPVVGPLLETRRVPVLLDLTGVAALAFTSANGVEALAALTARRDQPAFAVGAATARAARVAGFTDVQTAEGDVVALAELLIARRPAGPVLHAAGRPLAGDLVAALEIAGLTARLLTLYETVETADPTPPAIDAVLVHSPHAARVLAVRGEARSLAVAAISPAAAAALLTAGFTGVKIAASPDEAALLALLGSGPAAR